MCYLSLCFNEELKVSPSSFCENSNFSQCSKIDIDVSNYLPQKEDFNIISDEKFFRILNCDSSYNYNYLIENDFSYLCFRNKNDVLYASIIITSNFFRKKPGFFDVENSVSKNLTNDISSGNTNYWLNKSHITFTNGRKSSKNDKSFSNLATIDFSPGNAKSQLSDKHNFYDNNQNHISSSYDNYNNVSFQNYDNDTKYDGKIPVLKKSPKYVTSLLFCNL